MERDVIMLKNRDHSITWLSKIEHKLRQELEYNFWATILWGSPKREPKEDDNVKLAWVKINGQRTMLGVDNKTMKGYAMNEITPTWKLPLEPVQYNEFERWCTTFDV